MNKKGYLSLFLFITITTYFVLFFTPVTFTGRSSKILQETNNLLINGFRKNDDNNLARQAKYKLSIWLEKNRNNSNKKLVAKFLRARGNSFIALHEMNKAINDYKESMQYEPIAQIQVVICDLEEKQGKLTIPQECYAKAVNIFLKNKTPTKNVDFLIARFLSGDKSVFKDYKKFFRESTGREKCVYAMTAQGFFDETTYKNIVDNDYQNCNSSQNF